LSDRKPAAFPESERIVRKSVSFAAPFYVEGVEREQPAGTYEIEVVEELIQGLSFLAYRTVSTSIVLPLPGRGRHSYQVARIDPSLVLAAQGGAGKGRRT
jgi:hypothetical protein